MSALRDLAPGWKSGWWRLVGGPLTCCAPCVGPKGRTHRIFDGEPVYVTGHGAGEVFCARHARTYGNAPGPPEE